MVECVLFSAHSFLMIINSPEQQRHYSRHMTTSSLMVRLGIAGCGNVVSAYLGLAERLERSGQARIAAIHGPERHRARAQQEWRIPDFHPSYFDMLARPDIDAVLILTPMPVHAEMASAALKAGKHVLVEKPMATCLTEAQALINTARLCQRHLVSAPFTVLSPTFRNISIRLRRGEIGRVVSARGRYGWAGPDWADWFYKPGGGALFDLGVYNLTTLTGWLGPVRRVMAMAGAAIPERSVSGRPIRVQADDNTQVLLDFGGNRFATITTGFTLQQYRGPGLELFGTEGTINLLGDDWDPDGFELWRNSAGCWQLFKETQPDWPWTDGLWHLVQCIQTGAKPLVTMEHSFHVLEVMLMALASGRDGQAHLVESTFEPPVFHESGSTTAAHRVHDRTRTNDG
jgi:predicted dehydrogenase